MQAATVAWGPTGAKGGVDRNNIVVIVDVLRFSSTVTTAVANGFTVVAASDPDRAAALSLETGAPVSGKTGIAQFSLSPLDYLNPKHTEELILVSPNGAECVETASDGHTAFIGCFLNARTVGRVVRAISEREHRNVTIVAAGEVIEHHHVALDHRRFALEDYLACGLILAELNLRPFA